MTLHASNAFFSGDGLFSDLEHSLPRSKSPAAVLNYGADVAWERYIYHVLITHNWIVQAKMIFALSAE